MTAKVRKTLTLDPDLVEAFGGDNTALSTTVNEVLREEVERRQRKAALREYVAELIASHGEPDPVEVQRWRAVLDR